MSPSLRQATWPRALLAAALAALAAGAALAVAPRLSPAQPPAAPTAAPTAASPGPATARSTATSPSDPSTSSASASASASTTATASATASASAVPFLVDADESALPSIDHTPYPTVADKPVAPKPKEWLDATRVRFTRRGAGAPTCQIRRLREWLRVRCEGDFLAVGQLAGDAEGVTVWVHEPKDNMPNAAEITFPMRPGDRRIFQIFGFNTWGGHVPFPQGGPVLQAYWLEGAPAPAVILR